MAFYFLSLTLRSLPTGLVYAVWSGVGVVLIATIAWVFQSQKLDAAALCGMGLIVSGVVVINLFSGASTHWSAPASLLNACGRSWAAFAGAIILERIKNTLASH